MLLFAACHSAAPVSPADTDSTGTDSVTETETATGTDDGRGGPDEECISVGAGADSEVTCDDPDGMVAQQCDDFPSRCCCRTACVPTACPAPDDGMLPCLSLGIDAQTGVCVYAQDEAPLSGECGEPCVPASQCAAWETNGDCAVPVADAREGICLFDDDGAAFCYARCEMAVCDDRHVCQPVVTGSTGFEGVGVCVPGDAR